MRKIDALLKSANTIIRGKEELVRKTFMALIAGGHILLEDVPGVGKTTLALAFSRLTDLDFKRFQFTSDSVPADLTGFTLYDRRREKFVYQEGPVMTNLLLADEINRASSRTQSALLEVMAEHQVTVDGVRHELPDPFIVIATQNPIGSAGTQFLPESQLDRFMVRLHPGYPDRDSSIALLKDRQQVDPLDRVEPVLSREEIIALQREVEQVELKDVLYEYIVDLGEATRTHEHLALGISPRGLLALTRMARANAMIHDRDYVIPRDITDCVGDVFKHRLIRSSEARLNNIDKDAILADIMTQVPEPYLEPVKY